MFFFRKNPTWKCFMKMINFAKICYLLAIFATSQNICIRQQKKNSKKNLNFYFLGFFVFFGN